MILRCLYTVFLLAAALVLQGCERAKLTPLEPGAVILAFGDSLTVGVGTTEANSYPSVLSELTGHQVVNAGRSGEITAEGVARLPGVLADTRPELLLLLEGGNDILRNKDFGSVKANLASMIELAQNQGVQVVLIGVPPKSLFGDAAPFYQELADEFDLVFEDELIGDLLRTPKYKSDAIHFNQQGYQAMAESIYQLLVEEGAL